MLPGNESREVNCKGAYKRTLGNENDVDLYCHSSYASSYASICICQNALNCMLKMDEVYYI